MRRICGAIAFALCVALLATTVCFASSAAIVSPAENSIIQGDSFLVSVKVTEKKTVRVTVYEELEASEEELVAASVAKYTTDDLAAIASTAAIAAQNAEAELNGTAVSNVTYKLSDGTTAKTYISRVYTETAEYTNTKDVGFYTKQLSSVKPGLYRVEVVTLDEEGNAVETLNSYVAVKKKAAEEKTTLFQNQQGSTAIKFIQNLLKNLFR